jgi:hypothetical protein
MGLLTLAFQKTAEIVRTYPYHGNRYDIREAFPGRFTHILAVKLDKPARSEHKLAKMSRTRLSATICYANENHCQNSASHTYCSLASEARNGASVLPAFATDILPKYG